MGQSGVSFRFRFVCLVLTGLIQLVSSHLEASIIEDSHPIVQTLPVAKPPNVIVVLTDDQGWGDLSINGNPNLTTPNIDRLASQGARFDRFFVCPVCSPTRAEFLTGRYHPRSGVYSTSAGGERMNLDEMTIAQTFQLAGYTTGAFGKWHNGMQYPYHPNGRGFQEFYGFCSGHWGHYFDPMLEHNGKIVQGKGFVVDDFTDHLLAFMEKNRERPFFAYLPLNTPHSPMQVPDRWWNKFKEKELEFRHREPRKEKIGHTRAALAMCENVDWNVGRILKKLDALQLSDETIVVYFCDNGPNGSRWNGDMKGRKGSTDEGGVRSPLFIRYPDKIRKDTRVTQIGAAIDLLPTLAELCGIPVASSKKLDGMSLVPVLTKQKGIDENRDRLKNRIILNHWKGKISLRSQRFRLGHKGQLFEIEKDPGQRLDVASQYPERVKSYQQQVARFREEVVAGHDVDHRPFVVGHPGVSLTQVPARDGIPQGNIKRSNRFPNCSYFTNWIDTGDKITWEVEVGKTGDYEVELYYTCSPENLGSKIKLSFGKHSLSTTVTSAHDPPEQGAAEDRVPRMESYVKDFKPMAMGTIRLEKGKGLLELTAESIPGKEVMDFRLLMFSRKE
ncbi:MAG: arylsulfatase [Planctomycetota bacterium]|nr:arylsulfatase [Planctomycetota bacterium]